MAQSGHQRALPIPYLSRYDACPKTGNEHEAARIHCCSWWGGSLATGRARAATVRTGTTIGVLLNLASDDPETKARLAAFLQRLKELGWSEGRNLRIDYRWGMGDLDHHRKNAAELVALSRCHLVHGSTIMAPLQRATRTVPVVFVSVADPVAGGFASSLSRPGGNATGFTSIDYGMSGKWLELLKQIAPQVTRVGVIGIPIRSPGAGSRAVQAVASLLGVGSTRWRA